MERSKIYESRKPRRVLKSILLVSSLVLAACNDDNGDGERTSATHSTTTTTENIAPFEVTQDWNLPMSEPLTPRTMTAEQCAADFWADEDGQRQPVVQEEPLIVRVDGRCSPPLGSEEVGIYDSAVQQGPAPIVALNGDALGVECKTLGQQNDTILGTGSLIWLGVVTADGQTGFISETLAGFVDERHLPLCSRVAG